MLIILIALIFLLLLMYIAKRFSSEKTIGEQSTLLVNSNNSCFELSSAFSDLDIFLTRQGIDGKVEFIGDLDD